MLEVVHYHEWNWGNQSYAKMLYDILEIDPETLHPAIDKWLRHQRIEEQRKENDA